ncbi:MAG: hypothetical protein A4E58_02966 [Syntrophorhabdus sp. PtaB.Bin006]|nr:MAG: hypothetical protein A4E58_02966 [Syntrophorhabdus sp. PtaB.Bin006]
MHRRLFLKRALRNDLGTRHVTMSGGDTRSKIGSGTSERTPKIYCMIPSLFAKDNTTPASHTPFYTNLHSKIAPRGYPDDKEEAAEAYISVRRGTPTS